MSNYFNPVKIIKTENWLIEVISSIEKFKISAPIIVTSPGNRKRLNLDSKFDSNSIFSNVDSNPTFENCINAVKFCQNNTFDGVIALGGGSVMDLAKVVMAHLCLEESDIIELIEYTGKFPQTIPSIFLPTTHGTASEVTMWGTIWNMKEKKKYSISHPDLYPKIAILDGNLTLSLPMDISITTVMDALSHSFESIWNKNANHTSTDFAISAICSILDNGEALKENPTSLEIRKTLLHASTVAGLAFSNTTTAAAHSISYPLTIHYGIPHGVASSISLLPLLEINGEFIKEPLDRICNKNELTFDELKQTIKAIPQGIIPYTLNEWGIPENQLPKLATESFTKGRMDNNIVDLTTDDVLGILNELYSEK
ncbi:MAG: phosphonoacetaldehyde reductase [Candidatus Marinimicrobia bacterium]|nr:phosphonoacetaldehyde reductase [Candidatus Neomarinimicrobiota bacterium]